MTTRNQPKKVFITYNPARAEAARQVSQALAGQGLEAFLVEHATGAGESIEDTLWRALHEADAFVVVVGPEPLNPNVVFELGAADSLGKPIFLLAVEHSRLDLPFDLRRFRILPMSRANELPYLLSREAEARAGA